MSLTSLARHVLFPIVNFETVKVVIVYPSIRPNESKTTLVFCSPSTAKNTDGMTRQTFLESCLLRPEDLDFYYDLIQQGITLPSKGKKKSSTTYISFGDFQSQLRISKHINAQDGSASLKIWRALQPDLEQEAAVKIQQCVRSYLQRVKLFQGTSGTSGDITNFKIFGENWLYLRKRA